MIWPLLALAALTRLPAADSSALVRDALAAEARFDSRTALSLFQQANALRPDDPAVLQKISKQYSDAIADTPNPAEKQQLLTQALAFARRAVELAPRNAVNVLSLAICYGKLSAFADTRTKLEDSRLVKRYAEQALALDPDYALAHHVLGRWNYEVASLGFATRLLVRVIYGGLPDASTAEAVRQLQRATELAPDFPSHRVELGFALLADGQRDAAQQAFEQALKLPRREKYDEEAWARARAALEALK